jgi:hypothetical protein
VKALPEYRYDAESPSLLGKLLFDVIVFIVQVLGGMFDGRVDSATDIIGFTIIVAAIVLVVRMLVRRGRNPLRHEGGLLFKKKNVTLAPSVDIDRLIGAAVQNSHFRDAVRLLYLRTLADLRDAHIIEWRQHKTDSEYIREVRGRWHHDIAFAQAVRLFQSVWYGDQSVDAEMFERVRDHFDALRRTA